MFCGYLDPPRWATVSECEAAMAAQGVGPPDEDPTFTAEVGALDASLTHYVEPENDPNPFALDQPMQLTSSPAEDATTTAPETFDEPTSSPAVTATGDPVVVVSSAAPIAPDPGLALGGWDDADAYEAEGATVAPGAMAATSAPASAPTGGNGLLVWAAVAVALWVLS